ncbi:NADH-quinone oxidoreductase subunit L [Pedobacter puniceum]|uniref:NADH-quinone oxidoreductase subunit L n=1 Tax=Pedobacter puniceum TaxID=2666136 RepID=A0A7K0FN72_9SPHI|nr:NADH-quinone oxidoreductase subunit L [Pedobacter puniceum]MRX47429.1 NADH-quinone oxidoreductase subunit L [Pedobacter puniceum]
MIDLVWLIPLLPFIGFLINGLGRNILPKPLIGTIASLAVIGSFAISLSIFLTFDAAQPQVIHLFDWINVGSLSIPFAFQIDQLSIMMLLIITGIGSLIHIYSAGYMSHDAGFGKFFAYLNLFVFFMLLLVMGSNYVIMFIGWEGVGLCSYLLIGFWYSNGAYADAAKKAFIMNRIGDLGFLLGVFLIISTFGSVSFTEIFPKAAGMVSGDATLILITILLFIGATGKSAQLPLFTWLPDAMAGPTPVSALIHAATMVTAGIYMIARSNILFALSPVTLDIIAVVGLLTAVVAAFIALTQTDIKKVLAYSTVSQLGYMFLGLGVGAFTGAFFHVLTHAFFKALLFLGAGSVIHAMSNEQDMRNMGGLRKKLPVTFLTMLIGTIAIAGLPPFAGFFSKDEILAHVYEHNKLLWIIGLFGAFLTAAYMFRMMFLTFWGNFRGTEDQKHHLHESPVSMTFPLIVLAILSMVGGFMGVPHALGGHHWLNEYLGPVLAASNNILPALSLEHATEYMLMGLSVGGVIISIIIAYVKYVSKGYVPKEEELQSGINKLSYNKLYLDELYTAIIQKPLDILSTFFFKVVDKSGIDGLVNGLGKVSIEASKTLRLLQTGNVGFYIFAMVIGIVAVLVYSFIII